MKRYRVSAGRVLTVTDIQNIILDNTVEQGRREKLQSMYEGRHDIESRAVADGKPNNRLVHDYQSYIVDSFVGYFVGKPVTYNAPEERKEDLDKLKDIFNYNDEQSVNAELAEDAGIVGEAYELLYLDEGARVRFAAIDPVGGIPVFDDTVEQNIVYFIRKYDLDNELGKEGTTEIIEVYDAENVAVYKSDRGSTPVMLDRRKHNFNDVPVCIYQNNRKSIGDFERVISLIDAYDKMQSDNVNDFEAFVDAYLVLAGMEGTDSEDVTRMKEDRVLLLPEGDAKAEWLTKAVNDGYIENLKNRLDSDIHKFSKCPKLTDESFSNNLSGVAIKYKLIGFENATSIKERYFKKGLQRRIELIAGVLALFGNDYSYTDIEMTFTRNIPVNATEATDVVSKLVGIVSEETLLGQLPFIEDVGAEMERLAAQRPNYEIDYEGLDHEEEPGLLEE